MIKIWNSLRGRLESAPAGAELKWYCCGPTVYDSTHLGHARTYVTFDVLRRVLKRNFGVDTFYALGVTDVDDKIINKAKSLQRDPTELARHFEGQFFADLKRLNVQPPSAVTRVTEHMDEIREFIERIESNGFAYSVDSGVYFDVGKFVENEGVVYPKLRSVGDGSDDGQEAVAEPGEKRNSRDFALWKASKPGEIAWDSKWGMGRPGWHIECSAMTYSLFGEELDIHSGGIDLCFPHHCNEIAQCEAHFLNGSEWVKLWMHTGHLHIDGRKMSKSLKNFITVDELFETMYDGLPETAAADDFRLFCLGQRYRSSCTFSQQRLEDAAKLRQRFQRFFSLCREYVKSEEQVKWTQGSTRLQSMTRTCREQVQSHLANDFDTAEATKELAALCSEAQNLLDAIDEQRPCSSSVRTAADLVADSLVSSFGLHTGRDWLWGSQHATSESLDAESVLETFLAFRNDVRSKALEGFKGAKKEAKKAENRDSEGYQQTMKVAQEMLRLCDEARDTQLPELGVRLEDTRDGGFRHVIEGKTPTNAFE